jgi:hypothetical protein
MTSRQRSGGAALAALLACGAVLACETELSQITGAVGPVAYNFAVGPSAAGLPTGNATREVMRTLVVRRQMAYATGSLVVTNLTLPSGRAQDTTAIDSAAIVVGKALRALTGGRVYQVWAQAADGTTQPVFGSVIEYSHYYTGENNPVTGDSIFAPDSADVGTANTYVGSDDPLVDSVGFQLIPSDPSNTLNPFDPAAVNALVVSIEAGSATAPSAVQFLWRRVGIATGGTSDNVLVTTDTVYLSTNPPGAGDATPDTIEVTTRARSTLVGTGALTFGNYGGFDNTTVNPTTDYAFAPGGAGVGGARGPELSVDFRELRRPPIGFYYVGYVADAFGNSVLVDTLRSAWNKDDPTISRVSLFDADGNDELPGVVNREIRWAQVRNCASGAAVNSCQNSMGLPVDGTFSGLATFQLKVEPKGGLGVARTSVGLAGALPGAVVE